MTDQQSARRCGARIDGPRVGAHVVAWRKYCKRLTRHPSGRCHSHRRWTPEGFRPELGVSTVKVVTR